MNAEQKLAFHNAVMANGGNITDEIREQFGLSKSVAKPEAPSAVSGPSPEAATEGKNREGGPALLTIPVDWKHQHWSSKQKLVRAIDPDFEPDSEDRVSSIEARIEAELQRRADEGQVTDLS